MADLKFYAENTAPVALVAATEKTAVQVNAPTNQRVKLLGITIAFDSASTTAVPVRWKLIRVSTAGTSTALTLVKRVTSDSETIQSTAGENHSAEGTNGTIMAEGYLHPQQGMIQYFPFGQERILNGGERAAVKLTAPAVVNVIATLDCEE
jgi:hypothetical protein